MRRRPRWNLAKPWNAAANARVGSIWPWPGAALALPERPPAAEAWLGKLAAHPRLARRRAEIDIQRAALALERAQTTADVTLGGDVRFFRADSDAALVAGVSIPLGARHQNQGAIRAARETLAGAELGARAVEAELRARLEAAWRELAAAHAAADLLRRDALPPNEEAHAAVRAAYAEGVLPLLDVHDAKRALVGLRRELLGADLAYATALVRLDALADPAFAATTRLLSDR